MATSPLFSFQQTRRNTSIGCVERSRLFLSWVIASYWQRRHPICTRRQRRRSTHSRSDNQIRFLPDADASLRRKRISASFCPRDNFPTPLKIVRCIYFFSSFSLPATLYRHFPSRHDYFHSRVLADITLFLGNFFFFFCSSVNEPYAIWMLLRFASLNIAFQTACTTTAPCRVSVG